MQVDLDAFLRCFWVRKARWEKINIMSSIFVKHKITKKPFIFIWIYIFELYEYQYCKGSEILFYLQTNKLAFLCFTEFDRKHETPGSETKSFITHGIANRTIIFIFVIVPFVLESHRGDMESHLTSAEEEGCVIEWNNRVKGPVLFEQQKNVVCSKEASLPPTGSKKLPNRRSSCDRESNRGLLDLCCY